MVRKALLIYFGCVVLLPTVRRALHFYLRRQRKLWEEEEGLV